MVPMNFFNIKVDECVNEYTGALKSLQAELKAEADRLMKWTNNSRHILKKQQSGPAAVVFDIDNQVTMDALKIDDIINNDPRGYMELFGTGMVYEKYRYLLYSLKIEIFLVTITKPNCKFLLDIMQLGNFDLDLNTLDITGKNKMIKIANRLMKHYKTSNYLWHILDHFFTTIINEPNFIEQDDKYFIETMKEHIEIVKNRQISSLTKEGEENEEREDRGELGGGGAGASTQTPLTRGLSLDRIMVREPLEEIDFNSIVTEPIEPRDFYNFILTNMKHYNKFITERYTPIDEPLLENFKLELKHFLTSQNIVYLNQQVRAIDITISQVTNSIESFNAFKKEFLQDNRDMLIIKDNLYKLTNITKELNALNANSTTSINLHNKGTEFTQENKNDLIDTITQFITLFTKNYNTIEGIPQSSEFDIKLQKLIDTINPDDFNDTQKLLEFLSRVNNIDGTGGKFGTDILDERRVCGELDGEQIDGKKCINIITKCLSGNPNECLAEFNQLDFDKDINLKTMEYSVALNIATTLGFNTDTVTNAINKIKKDNPNLEISPKLIIIFNAIKAKIDYVNLKTYTPTFEPIEKPKGIPLRDVRIQTVGQTGGGNMNNYNNFIINLDALKKNLTMKGGSNNSIIVKKNLYYLQQLLKENNKQIDQSDLNKINRLIDKLQIGEHIINKIDIVITGLTRAINEKSVDLTDSNLVPTLAYQMLNDLYDKSKDKQAKNLQKVGTIVSLFHGLIPALGYRIP